MTVSKDAVVWAYRLLLNREPENDEVVRKHLNSASITDMVRAFLRSSEFKKKHSLEAGVGRYLDVTSIDVETKCSARELNEMIDRVGAEWTALGNTQPHWSVIVDEKYSQKNIGQNLDEFYETGRSSAKLVIAALTRNGVDPKRLEHVVDFGCGVGRLSLALAGYFGHVKGVDISANHIALAEARRAELDIRNISFSVITGFDELQRLTSFDLLVSYIVLQHNSPPVIAQTVRILLDKLNQSGVALFQVPTFSPSYTFQTKQYLKSSIPRMEMNIIPQKDLFEIIACSSCRVLEVREDNSGGPQFISQVFLVQKHAMKRHQNRRAF